MKTICIIPARGGSTRIPRKNIKVFMGKPIIAYSIEAAKESGLFDEIYVSTDDAIIAQIAMDYGAKVLDRPKELAVNEVGTQEVIGKACEQLGLGRADMVCCIYPTSPMMSVEDLERGLVALNTYAYDFTMSVGAEPLRDAAQFYWGTVHAFTGGIPLIDEWTGMIPIDENRICDINTMSDFVKAERMYKELHETD